MDDLTFNTPAGQTIDRELLVLLLNTSKREQPVWSPVGARVSESSMEMDWSKETTTDIMGKVRTTLKKPIVTQSFDPMPLDAGDPAAVMLWNLAVRKQDAAAMANQDVLILHRYAGLPNAIFAERYEGSAIEVTGNGGEGGGHLSMPITVTTGGTRTIGTAAIGADGGVTFTPDSAGGAEDENTGA